MIFVALFFFASALCASYLFLDTLQPEEGWVYNLKAASVFMVLSPLAASVCAVEFLSRELQERLVGLNWFIRDTEVEIITGWTVWGWAYDKEEYSDHTLRALDIGPFLFLLKTRK